MEQTLKPEVLDIVEAGIGGRTVGTRLEGRERFPIQVRYDSATRDDIERLIDRLYRADAAVTKRAAEALE